MAESQLQLSAFEAIVGLGILFCSPPPWLPTPPPLLLAAPLLVRSTRSGRQLIKVPASAID